LTEFTDSFFSLSKVPFAYQLTSVLFIAGWRAGLNDQSAVTLKTCWWWVILSSLVNGRQFSCPAKRG